MTGFSLIPVIDLKGGMVVHAREGRREAYQPVRSRLCSGAEPADIARALLDLHPFAVLYIADLDAIEQRGDNRASIETIRRQHPDLELWADTGIGDEGAVAHWLRQGLARPVIGSESLHDIELLPLMRERSEAFRPVLSLDYRGEEFTGPAALLDHPERCWPQDVLAMNLHCVGSDKGPDLKLIVELARRVPGCRVYAAGGVRSVEDLQQVKAVGAAGALLASALHDGRLGAAQLAQFS